MVSIANERDRYYGTQSPTSKRALGDASSTVKNEKSSMMQTIKTSTLWGGSMIAVFSIGFGLNNIRKLMDGSQDIRSNTNTEQTNNYDPEPQQPIEIRAVLELPSPTPTSTPRATATNSPDPASNLDFCTGTPELGKLCKVPYPPPPTPTPYPSCENMDQLAPGDWCIWPTATPGADPTEFGIVYTATPKSS